MGCGCGLLGTICALNGSRLTCFGDVNPLAIKNAKLNSILLDLVGTSFYCGSLFENNIFGEKFDLVVFNPPSIPGVPANNSEAALIREDEIIKSFYDLVPSFYRKTGVLLCQGHLGLIVTCHQLIWPESST